MYKYSKIISLSATLVWIFFAFSAFKGFHYWYAGFVVSLWFSLAFLNYRHETSLWHLKNRTSRFIRFYCLLFLISVIGDWIIGQNVAHLWVYPYYNSIWDWFRLYFIIYPFGGLSVLELIFFLSGLFSEKFVLAHRKGKIPEKIVNATGHFIDYLLIGLVVTSPILYLFNITLPFRHFYFYTCLFWVAITTINHLYHVRHSLHWIAIFSATLFMSVFLHEIPNTSVFEWRYYNAPILNYSIFEIPLWVIFGWYFLILVMLRFWMRFIQNKKSL